MRLTYGHSWEVADAINADRMASWEYYDQELNDWQKGYIEQLFIPEYAKHNAHMYYIKVKDQEESKAY